MDNDQGLDDPFVVIYPLARTNRYEFWNNRHGHGIVIVNPLAKTACEVGWAASLFLRWVIRRRGDDLELLNELGNTIFELHQRHRQETRT